MATYNDDWLAFPHGVGVLDRLPKIMEAALIPVPCTSLYAPGEIVAFDHIGDECDSLMWARVAGIYPSSTFPDPDARPRPVLSGWAVGIEVGVVRRFVVPDLGHPPEPEDVYEATRLQMADMRAILQAACEYGGDDIPTLIGNYVPLGPGGGVVGGYWTITYGSL